MGLFGRKTWSEKVTRAYNTFNDEAKPLLFPRGLAEAEEIATGLAECCVLDPNKCSAKQVEELLNVYAEVAAGRLISNQGRDTIISALSSKYGKTVWSNSMADRVCNYCEKMLEQGDKKPAETPVNVPEETPAEEETETEISLPEEIEEEETEASEETEETAEDAEEEPVEEVAEEAVEEQIGEPVEEIKESEDIRLVKKAVKKLTEKLELDGKGRKAVAEAMKPVRKSLVKGVLNAYEEDGEGAVKAAFCVAMAATEAYKVDDAVFTDTEKSPWKILKKDLGMDPVRLVFQAENDEEINDIMKALVRKTDVAEKWESMDEEVRKALLKAVCSLGFKKAAK